MVEAISQRKRVIFTFYHVLQKSIIIYENKNVASNFV